MIDWKTYISSSSKVSHGKMCFTGTRIMVATVLDNLAEGMPYDEIIDEYPPLKSEHISAAIKYAAELTHERILALP